VIGSDEVKNLVNKEACDTNHMLRVLMTLRQLSNSLSIAAINRAALRKKIVSGDTCIGKLDRKGEEASSSLRSDVAPIVSSDVEDDDVIVNDRRGKVDTAIASAGTSDDDTTASEAEESSRAKPRDFPSYFSSRPTVRELLEGSGKLQLLVRLVRVLRAQGARILIFSQVCRLGW